MKVVYTKAATIFFILLSLVILFIRQNFKSLHHWSILREFLVSFGILYAWAEDLLVVEVEDTDHHVDHDEDWDECVDQEEEEYESILSILLHQDVWIVRSGQKDIHSEYGISEGSEIVDVVFGIIIVLLVI